MTRRRKLTGACGFAVLCAAAVFSIATLRDPLPKPDCPSLSAMPELFPDYDGTTIPPNIAPLNFVIRQSGQASFACFRPAVGEPLWVKASEGRIAIPTDPWRRMLEANVARTIEVDVYVKEGQWRKAPPLRLTVAGEPVDPYVVYRQLPPVFNMWLHLDIRQRCLESFEERSILHNRAVDDACINCHTFCQRDPSKMLFHTRPGKSTNLPPAMVVAANGQVTRHDPRGAAGTLGPAVYSDWHPSGKAVAFCTNTIRQLFHTGSSAGQEPRDVVDLDGNVVIYLLDERKTLHCDATASPRMLETYPAWSPDGKWLYYCAAPIDWNDRTAIDFDRYQKVRHSLMRVEVDLDAGRIGPAEVVLSSEATGKSIVQPRVSPDGRFVVFCMCDYGGFPVNQASSDLYLLDLQAPAAERKPIRLECNSDRSESWHSWSSNSRWLVFASKRRDGLLGRLYLTHIDAQGRSSKPILLPQEDPTSYDRCIETHNLPELVTGPVVIPSRQLAGAANTVSALRPTTLPAASGPWSTPGGPKPY